MLHDILLKKLEKLTQVFYKWASSSIWCSNSMWCFHASTVSGTTLVYRFISLRNWSIYLILFSHFCLFRNGLFDFLTQKDSHFIRNTKMLFTQYAEFMALKLQTDFSQNVSFIDCKKIFWSHGYAFELIFAFLNMLH